MSLKNFIEPLIGDCSFTQKDEVLTVTTYDKTFVYKNMAYKFEDAHHAMHDIIMCLVTSS